MEEVRYQNPMPAGAYLQGNQRKDIYNEHNFLIIGDFKDAKFFCIFQNQR